MKRRLNDGLFFASAALAVTLVAGCTATKAVKQKEYTAQAVSSSGSTYPTTLEVTQWSNTDPSWVLVTATGVCYEMPDHLDYELGNFVSAIMYDNGTPDYIPDDRVLKTQYSGWSYIGE